jgi:peptidoglycan LD-endopeptidase CwlK
MPSFSLHSRDQLSTCDIRLQRLFNEVIKEFDCSIIVGHRGRDAQEAAFQTGNSKVHYGESLHNYEPSCAVDVVPFPLNWENQDSFKAMAAVVKRVAAELEIPIVWGGDWLHLHDMDHFELTDTSHAKLPEA